MQHTSITADAQRFSTSTEGLDSAGPCATVELASGQSFPLRIAPVRNQIDGAVVRMLAYNASIPGPSLRVPQHAEVDIDVTNASDLEQTVHWHGLRLDNRFDGVPHDTQAPIPPGGRYTHRLRFPDPGLYWYHPHMREDYAQEMGLYGTILVTPAAPSYWPPVDHEIVITVDDVLIEDGQIAAFSRTGPDRTAMGRFGNVMLTNGQTQPQWSADQGQVIRLYLVNTANTRVFNLHLPGARMKLVGGDSGRYERESFVDSVLLSPSERAVIDVCLDRPGDLFLEHRTPDHAYQLGAISVSPQAAASFHGDTFETLRTDPDLLAERRRLDDDLHRPPDKTLAFVGEMAGMAHHNMHDKDHGHSGHHGPADAGIEWEDTMPAMNLMANPDTMQWKIVDRDTGLANHDIGWSFRAGDRIKIRLVNEPDSDHPMHHPFHIHGERFLVLSRDGHANPNLVWKDTVLVRTGETVDILLDASNPGLWMAHCHIAEHAESGMMFNFRVGGGRL